MNPIRLAIERPIAVVAGVLMIVLFGLVALQTIPIQLAPDVRRPIITVETVWPGAAPAEMEREIIMRQEEVLSNLEGLTEMESNAWPGESEIQLEFAVGTNMDRAMLLVSNELNRVQGYPNEADEPTLGTATSEDKPIAWFNLTRLPGNDRAIQEYGEFIDDVVAEQLERVPGVARVNHWGGTEREVRVIVTAETLARYRLTVPDLVNALRAADSAASAGDVEENKLRHIVRVEGDLSTVESIRDVMVVSSIDAQSGRIARVTIGDIADVRLAYTRPTSLLRFNGEPAISFNVVRQAGANVIETMNGIRETMAGLEAYALPNAGLKATQVYDETDYINASIDLVTGNIWVGGVLAALVLMLFLRSPRATLIVSIAIPVSVIGSFVAMAAMGRSINVISLAGLAFAVGMVVDAAIVVLENIFRLREKGMAPRVAAYEGARQVWGAILVSALTTVMVFVPILVMELEAGQIFRDIAVAICVSVLLSLVIAVTLIPALGARMLTRVGGGKSWRIRGLDDAAAGFSASMRGFAQRSARSRTMAAGVVTGICTIALALAWLFLPKLEYLPEGNQNFLSGSIYAPPGYNLATMEQIAGRVEAATRPYWQIENPEGAEEAADGGPLFSRFYFGAGASWTWVGAGAVDPDRVKDLRDIIMAPLAAEPGTSGFFRQPSIFGRGLGGTRSINLNVSGPDVETILLVVSRAERLMRGILPASEGNQLRILPDAPLGSPELRIHPDRLRLADNGITVEELAMGVDAFNSGLRVSEITVEGQQMDLTLTGPDNYVSETQGLGVLPIVTRAGAIVPVGALATIEETTGPTQVRRLDGARTVTIQVGLGEGVALETALDMVEAQVIDPLRAAGLPPGVKLFFSGTADKLDATWDAMVINLLLALVIVYLVMAVLFESFVYPAVVMVSVPVAAAGGVLGLVILNLFQTQALDMLTMLGFVILIGIVVNNAILLVHQTLQNLREEGMGPAQAIEEATANRIRPIFMSTLTSVCGMLPLVVFPGAGSELYRGLGSVVVGGLALSAVLTLTLVPPLMSLVLRLGGVLPQVAVAPRHDDGAAEQPAE